MPLDTNEGAMVDAAAGEVTYFAFEVPAPVRDLQVTLSGGLGDANLMVFNGPYLLSNLLSYSPSNSGSEERCNYSLAPGAVSYDQVVLANETLIGNISSIQGQEISVLPVIAINPSQTSNNSVILRA